MGHWGIFKQVFLMRVHVCKLLLFMHNLFCLSQADFQMSLYQAHQTHAAGCMDINYICSELYLKHAIKMLH